MITTWNIYKKFQGISSERYQWISVERYQWISVHIYILKYLNIKLRIEEKIFVIMTVKSVIIMCYN